MHVLPVTVAIGMVQRGIIAGKSGVLLAQFLVGGSYALTEGADSSHDTQWLPVAACLHVLCNLEDLAGHLGGDTAGSLGNLETTEDIAPGVTKGLALLERDASSQPVPVLTDQVCVLEHDGLPVEQARFLPWLECLLRAVDGGFELLVCALGDACHQVVGRRIMQVNPLCRLGRHELVVKKVLCVLGRLYRFVARGIRLGHGSRWL